MVDILKQRALIYLDRSSNQWIVRDPEGNYWIVPVIDDPWQRRQPLELTEEMELEPVAGHYKYMLNLPLQSGTLQTL